MNNQYSTQRFRLGGGKFCEIVKHRTVTGQPEFSVRFFHLEVDGYQHTTKKASHLTRAEAEKESGLTYDREREQFNEPATVKEG